MSESFKANNFKRALLWRKEGVSAFPLSYRTKRPIVRWSQYRNGTPTPAELKRFFTSYKTNLAVVCGGCRGLVVIDFDRDNGYTDFLKDLSSGYKKIFESTYRVKTPRGVHVYFWSNGMESLKDKERKIDVKGIGGYVVAPISVHPSGEKYQDFDDFNIGRIKSLPSSVIRNLFPVQEEKINWDKVDKFEQKESDGFCFPTAGFDLEDIRRSNPILRLAMQYTRMFPEKRNGGRYWKGKCPLPTHADNDPSFWVDTKTGLCGCFGSCELNDKATDVIGLYAKLNNISYGEAIKKLRERY